MNKTEQSANMHDRILSSALQIFSEKGYAEATVNDISQNAGCNTVTIFRHFGDKMSLFNEVVEKYKDFHFNADDLDSRLSYMNLHGDFKIMADYFFNALYKNIHILRIFINDGHAFESARKHLWVIPDELKSFVSDYLAAMYPDKISSSDSALISEMFLSYITRTCLRLNVHEGIEEYSKQIATSAKETMACSVDMIVNMVLMIVDVQKK